MAAKLVSLAGARMVAQVLGLCWFLLAARAFDATDFGILSSALVLVVVIGAFSDLGTTRTVVRHVAADTATLRSTYLRAVGLRAAGGVVCGVIAVVVAPHVQSDVSTLVVAVAAVIAIASGCAEVGFAAMRSVGAVGVEVGLLIGERALFVVGGTIVIALGHGVLAVLLVYAATNCASALVAAARVVTIPGGHGRPSGPMLDAEGRRTAVGSTLVIIGPRVSAVLLMVLSTSTVVGTFTIAQKAPEALATLGIAVLMPVLPVTRRSIVDDHAAAAVVRAAQVTAAVVAVVAPVALFSAVHAESILDLLFDAGDRDGAPAALALLSVGAVIWVVRTYGEVLLLAQERAVRYLVALGIGIGANVAVGVVLVPMWDAAGAAAASLVTEGVIVLAVFVALRRSITREAVAAFAPVVGAVSVAGVVLLATRDLPMVVGAVVAAAAAAVGLVLVGLPLRDRERRRSADGGDDADVREQVGGDLAGDGVEAVEYLAGPTDHL